MFCNDVDHGVVMEPMQEKLASSQFDFGYINYIRIELSQILHGDKEMLLTSLIFQ